MDGGLWVGNASEPVPMVSDIGDLVGCYVSTLALLTLFIFQDLSFRESFLHSLL